MAPPSSPNTTSGTSATSEAMPDPGRAAGDVVDLLLHGDGGQHGADHGGDLTEEQPTVGGHARAAGCPARSGAAGSVGRRTRSIPAMVCRSSSPGRDPVGSWREPLDDPAAGPVGAVAQPVVQPGDCGPARTRRSPARSAIHPRTAAAERQRHRRRRTAARRRPCSASSASRSGSTLDCGLAHAPIRDPRGRVAQYASRSLRRSTRTTGPRTCTCRCRPIHGKVAAARGLACRSRLLSESGWCRRRCRARPRPCTARSGWPPRRRARPSPPPSRSAPAVPAATASASHRRNWVIQSGARSLLRPDRPASSSPASPPDPGRGMPATQCRCRPARPRRPFHAHPACRPSCRRAGNRLADAAGTGRLHRHRTLRLSLAGPRPSARPRQRYQCYRPRWRRSESCQSRATE